MIKSKCKCREIPVYLIVLLLLLSCNKDESTDIEGEIKYDVCIIGAGTGGMGAAYALSKFTDLKVLLVEKQPTLGGTAVNAWVQTWIEGINPPYLKEILENVGINAIDIKKSILPVKYGDHTGYRIILPSETLAMQYNDFINKAKNITVLTNAVFTEVNENYSHGGQIRSIKVKTNDGYIDIIADFFIDSSGEGILCQAAGAEFYVGEDPYSRFKEDLMPKNDKVNTRSINSPSLFYQLLPPDQSKDDNGRLEKVTTVYMKKNEVVRPDYINSDGYIYTHGDIIYHNLFCNPLTGLGISGHYCLGNVDGAYEESKKRFLEHWKFVKLTLEKEKDNPRFENGSYRGWLIKHRLWNYTGKCAPMLGIRESYRIKCEYMLNQNDLTKLIDCNNLEDHIACGSHDVDFHIRNIYPSNIIGNKLPEFNKNVKPSGIPYKSLIPVGLKNVLVACRAYGASHIALSARRLNKDMAQLGWAAGHAIGLCFKYKLSSVQEIYEKKHIAELQEITGFKENVRLLLEIYHNK